jgi:hypothetical protein
VKSFSDYCKFRCSKERVQVISNEHKTGWILLMHCRSSNIVKIRHPERSYNMRTDTLKEKVKLMDNYCCRARDGLADVVLGIGAKTITCFMIILNASKWKLITYKASQNKLIPIHQPTVHEYNINIKLDRDKVNQSALKMEAVCSSETLVSNYKPTRRYYPEDTHRRIKL